MGGMGEFRTHVLAVLGIIIANTYLLRLMEMGTTGAWHWLLFFVSALMLGSSIYVGLVLGIGGGIGLSLVIEATNEWVARVSETRQRVIEKSGVIG